MEKEIIARRLIDNGYIEEVQKLIKQVCAPIFFRSSNGQINQGTMTLIKGNQDYFGITAKHVAEKIDTNDYDSCQMGDVTIDNVSSLSCSNLDLATYRLTEDTIKKANHKAFPIQKWPVSSPQKNDLVIAGGYPGIFRNTINEQYDVAFTWFACRIQSVSDEKFGISLNLHSSYSSGIERVPDNADLGGCSGGPVFRITESILGKGISTTFELIGIIFEYSSDYELLLAHPLSSLSSDGIFYNQQ